MDIFTEIKASLRLHALRDYTKQELLAEIERRVRMAKQRFFDEHWNTKDRDKADGVSSGRGWVILWDADETDPPYSFAIAKYVIGAVMGRIRFIKIANLAVMRTNRHWIILKSPRRY